MVFSAMFLHQNTTLSCFPIAFCLFPLLLLTELSRFSPNSNLLRVIDACSPDATRRPMPPSTVETTSLLVLCISYFVYIRVFRFPRPEYHSATSISAYSDHVTRNMLYFIAPLVVESCLLSPFSSTSPCVDQPHHTLRHQATSDQLMGQCGDLASQPTS